MWLRWRLLLLLIALLSVSFAPIPGPYSTTLIGWDPPDPDPNAHTQRYSCGIVLPWLEVGHTWQESFAVSEWSLTSFRIGRLILHLALSCLAIGLIMLWQKRGREAHA
jgi:hypothetical protein